MHFGRYVSFWARRRGEDLAISCDGESISWAGFDRASATLAAHLREQGVVAGDRVGCLLGNSIEWCVSYAASLRLGTIFVPLNPMFGGFELEQIASDADCAAIVSCPSQMAKLGVAAGSASPEQARIYLRRDLNASAALADVLAADRAFVDPVLSDDDLMLISYTSGTTGLPKGVALTHRSVDTAVQGVVLNYALRGGEERMLMLAPLSFTGGVISNLSVMLATGASGHLEKSVDPARSLSLLTERRITFCGGVPALWDRIAQAPGFAAADLSSLHAAYTGGAPVPRPLLETFLAKGVTIRQQYGFTEACGGVSSPDEKTAIANPVSCGFALPAMDLEIRDDAGRRAGQGVVGEIHARGPQLMQGYWNKPEATAETFDGDWYRTGDLAIYDQDGGIVIVDRKKNMLISGGVNIYPAEVERGLAQIPGVVECVVLGLRSERWGDEVAAIVFAPSLSDPEAVMAQAREVLGSYKAPKHLVLSPEPLPKTASNKIARSGLPDLFARLSARPQTSLSPA